MPFGWIRSIFSSEPVPSPYTELHTLSQRLRAQYPNLNINISALIDPLGYENIRMELGPHGNRYVYPLSSLDYSYAVSRVEGYLEHHYVMDFEEANSFVANYFVRNISNFNYGIVRRSEHSDGYDIRVFTDLGNRYFTNYLPATQMTRSNIRLQLRGAEFQLLMGQEPPVISTASNPLPKYKNKKRGLAGGLP